ncbi:hypothetical protein DPMN_144159 [Dreissena polymorpha]|uniref:Uncharacterized protein n=1 Tax=Dreissena polymorpha TaxID=45954 RepID=A0A9D4JKD0_DREPO|nr:hypothetical protein DPMN_144159 [Dreissena polymorpha]
MKRVVIIEVGAVFSPPVYDCVFLGQEFPVCICYNTSLGPTGLREGLKVDENCCLWSFFVNADAFLLNPLPLGLFDLFTRLPDRFLLFLVLESRLVCFSCFSSLLHSHRSMISIATLACSFFSLRRSSSPMTEEPH